MTATTARAGDSPAVFVVKGSEPALVDRGVELLLAELTSPEATGAEAQDPTGARGNSLSRSKIIGRPTATRT